VSRSDEELVADALAHLAVLRAHLTRGDLEDQTIADAVSLRLAASIEAISRGSHELRVRAFGDEWALMWATRNRIAHGYAYVDMLTINATVRQDLPWFEGRLLQEVRRASTD
jgi:uncharacterized protein with HEPN domain